MRKCFLTDDSGHWYAVPVDSKGFFNFLCDQSDEEEDWEEFEDNFGDMRLDRHISSYSFNDLQEDE
jgi:hypothetical protein